MRRAPPRSGATASSNARSDCGELVLLMLFLRVLRLLMTAQLVLRAECHAARFALHLVFRLSGLLAALLTSLTVLIHVFIVRVFVFIFSHKSPPGSSCEAKDEPIELSKKQGSRVLVFGTLDH